MHAFANLYNLSLQCLSMFFHFFLPWYNMFAHYFHPHSSNRTEWEKWIPLKPKIKFVWADNWRCCCCWPSCERIQNTNQVFGDKAAFHHKHMFGKDENLFYPRKKNKCGAHNKMCTYILSFFLHSFLLFNDLVNMEFEGSFECFHHGKVTVSCWLVAVIETSTLSAAVSVSSVKLNVWLKYSFT